jgi:arsenite-transporting ATPase
MIPGFSYVIYLGYLLEKLTDDSNLIIVLDSPSSGHALTMLESTKNFNEIFEGGVIYEDTKKMLEVLTKESFTQINIITLPTILAVNEAVELEGLIKDISPKYAVKVTCNNCLFPFASESQPDFLKTKISNEEIALGKESELKKNAIPHSLQNEAYSLIKDLVPSVESLV